MVERITLFPSGGYVSESIDENDPSLPPDPCAVSCGFACPGQCATQVAEQPPVTDNDIVEATTTTADPNAQV